MATQDEIDDRRFLELIAHLGDGETVSELSDELIEMERRLNDVALSTGTKAKGELTLKLKFTSDEHGVCTIEPESKVTYPKRGTPGSLMFHDPKGGRLHRTPPIVETKQTSLDALFRDDDDLDDGARS